MKKAKIWILVFFIFILFSLLLYYKINSIQYWRTFAEKYIENTYSGEFILISEKKQNDKIIFYFCTNDNNKIDFELSCWWGGLSTPWGSLDFIPQRHFLDNFPQKINESIVYKNIVYDVSDKSLDEMVEFIKEKHTLVSKIYSFYGIDWMTPKLHICLKYNEKEVIIQYDKQNDNILKDSLIRSIY